MVLDECFDGLVVDDALDGVQTRRAFFVMQVHAHATRGADVGQCAVIGAGEMQEVAQSVLDALQRDGGIGVRDFTEVEEDVVQCLQ
ncbi:hypothetical protein PSFL111601_27955 [Pseudomonas floridensis]